MKQHIILSVLLMLSAVGFSQTTATLRIDSSVKHQKVTGFGAFVCSPGFAYNHMTTAEIKKVWGTTSTLGCNIMRLYIPIGKNSWGQSLATAKQAKQLGLIVFASPWGQPAEWKTNNSSNAVQDGKQGKLKRENWADYAQYLEDYVQYMRKNGVELDAISIQNEPDWTASYAGCLWSASEIAEFVKIYGKTISCKVMAPETLAVSDAYANALNKADVLDGFDIYGGHQYGGIQSAYKNLGKKGKEIWMTEYLINWDEVEHTTRNFDFSKDFFNFFRAINTCMLGDFNAWVHYAAKRYYALLGDGTKGFSSGAITRRGYIMAHFAKFVTGMTRVDGIFSGGLEGSTYQSSTCDSVVAVIANSGNDPVRLTLDLPFYTQKGERYVTGKTLSMQKTALTEATENCRPAVDVPAQSVTTVLYVRARDRQPSDMKGIARHYDLLDDMNPTKTTFGTTYKLTNKTKTFDSNNKLISSRTDLRYGYVELPDRYSQLVMHVKKVSSTNLYTAGATTLTYVNAQGEISRHEYGRYDLSRMVNFDMIFDLSPATLPDGCKGLLSLSCDNVSSHLTISFGDVYFSTGYQGILSGSYVSDDSNVLDFSSDKNCTSVDMTAVTSLPETLPWLDGTNRVAYVPADATVSGSNIIKDSRCASLMLDAQSGDFRPAVPFTADAASLTVAVNGKRLVVLPFNAAVPEGVKAYGIADDWTLQELTSIPAHQPVLIEAAASATFLGQGEVAYATSPLDAMLRGTYVNTFLSVGDYVLGQQNGTWGLLRLTDNVTLSPFEAYARPAGTSAGFIPFVMSTGITPTSFSLQPQSSTQAGAGHQPETFNLQGQKVNAAYRGIVIVDGKKYVKK